MLQVAVDLLPPEITDARRSRTIRKAVFAVVIAALLLVALGYSATVTRTRAARQGVDQSRTEVQRLTRQQGRYAEIVSIQAQSGTISAELSTLLATDVRWSQLLASLKAVAPDGVLITSVSGTLQGQPAKRSATGASAAPSSPETRPIGTLTVNGTSTDKIVLAAYLDALAKVDGLSNTVLGTVGVQDRLQHFTIQADITAAAVGGRYAPKPSTRPGRK